MELKQFIKEVLSDITMAVVESREELKDVGGLIAPPVHKPSADRISVRLHNSFVTINEVEFEVLLSESQHEGNKKGVSVKFSAINGGIKNEKGGENSSNTKIKFTIPISFPVPDGHEVSRSSDKFIQCL